MKTAEPKAGYLSRSSSSAFTSTYSIPRANSSRTFHLGFAAVLRAAHKSKVGARAEARSRANVCQSVGPQPLRARTVCAARESSVALPRGLRLKSGMHSVGAPILTPNPSIEGMPKRLRLSITPHVKR
jgi:hypothetical protein